jgi:hypothetical protein
MNKKLIWYFSFLLAMLITTLVAQFFIQGSINAIQVIVTGFGSLIGWMLVSRVWQRKKNKQGSGSPLIDERYLQHAGVSGFWSFVVLNLLVISALIQPWISIVQAELWISILVAGLLFWFGSLLLLEKMS